MHVEQENSKPGDSAPDEEKHSGRDMVEIRVNNKDVCITGPLATGQRIKQTAIAQGVAIQENFILHEELPNGTSKVIGDHDEVHLHQHMKFTAIRHDDNS